MVDPFGELAAASSVTLVGRTVGQFGLLAPLIPIAFVADDRCAGPATPC